MSGDNPSGTPAFVFKAGQTVRTTITEELAWIAARRLRPVSKTDPTKVPAYLIEMVETTPPVQPANGPYKPKRTWAFEYELTAVPKAIP